ncbi:MAG TPA: hypothetical protein VJ084_04505 [Nitrospinota bacterium]|nr:hypothetical protein [Nitrospinota bacterium]
MMEKLKLFILILLMLAGMGFIIIYINHEVIFYQRLATPLNW